MHILEELKTWPAIRISTLAKKFDVSDETIRRDLDELSADGLLNRTYGGASITPMSVEPSLNERYHLLLDERVSIARRAAQLVNPGEVLMLDAGSTVSHFAKQLAQVATELTIITNNLGAATTLAANPGIRIIVCPGNYDVLEGGVFGPETTAFLQRFLANICFISASGLTPHGPTEANSGSAWVKRAMLGQAQRRILLIDNSKYARPGLEVVCSLNELDDIVTDQAPPPTLLKRLDLAAVRIHIASV